MSKHTPGPWRLHDMETATVVAGRPGVAIADCNAKSRNEDENAANARLIAAAPDLLADAKANLVVLKNLATYLRKHESLLPPVSLASLEIRIEATRAAIAKAKGGAA